MDNRIVIFTDLDDSLIQTKRKLPKSAKSTLASTDREGNPVSYITDSQRLLLELFVKRNSIVVPVTGRNTDALNRVNFDFKGYRSTSHGAVVLKDKNTVSNIWLDIIGAEVELWSKKLENSSNEINKMITKYKLDATSKVIIDQGIPSYVSVKGTEDDIAFIQQLEFFELLDDGYRFHKNGRNYAILPPYASKRKSVEFIKTELDVKEDDLVMGIGDSLSDLEFLQSCEYSVIPTNSQIAKELIYA